NGLNCFIIITTESLLTRGLLPRWCGLLQFPILRGEATDSTATEGDADHAHATSNFESRTTGPRRIWRGARDSKTNRARCFDGRTIRHVASARASTHADAWPAGDRRWDNCS